MNKLLFIILLTSIAVSPPAYSQNIGCSGTDYPKPNEARLDCDREKVKVLNKQLGDIRIMLEEIRNTLRNVVKELKK